MASYVLVPGAGGDEWYWHRLVPALRERGHDAVAVALPAADDSAGWSEYADVIVDAIGDRLAPVLVAQSLGGFSAPLACVRKPVEQIVLLNAMIPEPGETGEAWWSNTGQREAQLEYLATIGVTPEEASDDRVLYFHDVPADVVEEAERRGDPGQSWTPMTQPWPLAAWPATPTRVLVGRDDPGRSPRAAGRSGGSRGSADPIRTAQRVSHSPAVERAHACLGDRSPG